MPTYKKYFKHKFLLNGVELNNVSIGASAIGKFEEPLDEAGLHLPFTMRDYEYPMRGLLQILSEDYKGKIIDTTYIILSDEVEEGSKYGEWKHNLHVMEYSGKYDAYLYHTFTYTKPLKNDNPAPFAIIENVNGEGATGYNLVVRLQPINVRTSYYANEPILFPQVSKAYQGKSFVAPIYHTYSEVDAFIKVDGGSKHILSNSSTSIQLSEGSHYIDYGINSVVSSVFPTGGERVIYRFYVNAISRSGISLLDALNIVRDSKPFESKLYHEATRLFNIDESITSYLSKIELPQMFLQKATMRQILNTMFSYINAISRFIYNSEDIDTLSMDEFNKVIGSFDIQDVIAFSSNQEATTFYNQGVVWGERMLPTSFEEETMVSPAENLYKTVRSMQIQLKDTNFGIQLEAELYQPKLFSVMIDQVKFQAMVGEENDFVFNNFVLDLTPRFINREEWQLKLTTVNFPTTVIEPFFGENLGLRQNKVSNLYWQQGSKKIEFAEVFGEVLETNLIKSTIGEALKEHFTRNMIPAQFKFDAGSGANVLVTRYQFSSSLEGITNTQYYNQLKFQLKYITFESFPFQTHRENIANSPYYTEGRLNQSDKAMNISFASMRAHGDTQRSGVPSITFTKLYEDYQDILRWGMKDDDDYIIVEEKFEYHNEFVKATYTATKDHNRLSLWTKVDQEYRWQEIPQSNQVFERQELFNENIIVTNPDTTLTEQLTMIKDTALELIFGTLMNDWKDDDTDGKTKVTLAYVRTDGFNEIYPDTTSYKYAILAPVRSFGGKHGFSFVFGFDGNQVAGDKLDFDGTNYYNKAVRYTDENGEFTTLWFTLATKFLFESGSLENNDGFSEEERHSNYPLTRFLLNMSPSDFITHQSGSLDYNSADYNGLMFGKKDKSQSIKLAIQTSVFPLDYKEYVFGINFFTNNFIVNNPETEFGTTIGTTLFFYPYTDGTQYDKFSVYRLKTTSGIGTAKMLVSGSNVTFSNGQFRFGGDISLTNVTSWAIADEYGNLYMACNKPYNGFNVSRYHFYPNQQVIGSEKYSDGDVNINMEGLLTLGDEIGITSFVFPVVTFADGLTITTTITTTQSTNFVVNMSNTFNVSDEISVSKSSNFEQMFNDKLSLGETIAIIKSTDYLFNFSDGFEVSDATFDIASFVFPVTSFNDQLSLDAPFEVIKSTNYVSDLTSVITLSDSSTIVQPIAFNTSFSDTITVSETIGVHRNPTNWVYWGTSGSYNNTVTNIASGSNCNSSSVIDAWLETTYPASNYSYGYIMRVLVSNEDLVLCDPRYYYYFATS